MKIKDQFDKIGSTTLTQIGKKLYNLEDFIEEQEDTLKRKEEDFIKSFEIIKKKMMKTYELFIYQKPQIQSEWLSFVKNLDSKLEKSLK